MAEGRLQAARRRAGLREREMADWASARMICTVEGCAHRRGHCSTTGLRELVTDTGRLGRGCGRGVLFALRAEQWPVCVRRMACVCIGCVGRLCAGTCLRWNVGRCGLRGGDAARQHCAGGHRALLNAEQ